MAELTNNLPHEVVLPMQVEHGEAVVVLDAFQTVLFACGFEPADFLEQILGLLQSTLVFEDNRFGHSFQFVGRKPVEQCLDRVAFRGPIGANIDFRFGLHVIPTACPRYAPANEVKISTPSRGLEKPP